MLTEMDEEFGVSGLAEEMFGRNIPQRNSVSGLNFEPVNL